MAEGPVARGAHRGGGTSGRWRQRRAVVVHSGVPGEALHETKRELSRRFASSKGT